jgi:uncharacterized HAD superfamily protein
MVVQKDRKEKQLKEVREEFRLIGETWIAEDGELIQDTKSKIEVKPENHQLFAVSAVSLKLKISPKKQELKRLLTMQVIQIISC